VDKRKRTAAPAASTTTAKKSRAGTRNNVKEAPANLPYELTDEELKKQVDADVKRQLAPKQPEPKEKIDPTKAKQFLKNLTRPPPSLPSNYDRSIMKSHKEHVQRSGSSSARGKTIPQLGEQKNQSCPPLNVFSDIDYDPEVAAHDLGFTLAQYLGQVEFPTADLAYRYQHGKPLVRPEEVRLLPTQMRRLHEWYMEASKEGSNWLMVGIRDEHYFSGNDEINIEFDELFQLYNQDAIDKSIVSCYCL
jgi:hypothetical protein